MIRRQFNRQLPQAPPKLEVLFLALLLAVQLTEQASPSDIFSRQPGSAASNIFGFGAVSDALANSDPELIEKFPKIVMLQVCLIVLKRVQHSDAGLSTLLKRFW